VPWEIIWGPDNWIWMTERTGRISRINPETGEQVVLYMIDSAYNDTERGLLGAVLHPDFTNNPYMYVVYDYLTPDIKTYERLMRLTYDGKKLTAPLIMLDSIPGAPIHEGSRLLIDENLKLFMTTGETGNGILAQDLNSLNGKILRMNLDGSIPDDNPFPNSYIWTWGHRNPQGLVKANGILYSSEQGPDTDDEINIIMKGRNYGWPVVAGYCDKPSELQFCQDSNVVEPIMSLTPSYTLATCGLTYYDKDLIPEWKNSLLVVTLKANELVQLPLDGTHTHVNGTNYYFAGQFGRLRDVCVSPDGRVFLATSNKDGRGNPRTGDDRIIEIKPSTSSINDQNSGDEDNTFFSYPNPAENEITFHLPDVENLSGSLMILDMFGNVLKSFEIRNSSDEIVWDRISRDGNYCPSGVYLARFSNNIINYECSMILY
jgi:glucose/arabinose dehydrogenase